MIVDVIDLKFKELQFSQTYEMGRFQRGKNLYNRQAVTVIKVSKEENENYYVNAKVNGKNDLYNVTLDICGKMINDSSCTCEDYYKGNLCKHIIATSMEVIEPHYASTKEGQKKLEEKKREEARLYWEEYRRKQKEEHERRLYEEKYKDGLRAIEMYKTKNDFATDNKNFNLIDLYEKTQAIKHKQEGELTTDIKITFVAEIYDSQTLRIYFKIGKKRMYIVNNIIQLYKAYKTGTELFYGKQLRFIPKKENFSEDSKWLFDYIIRYVDMLEYYNSLNKNSISRLNEKEILIKGEKIDEFFNLIPDKKIWFHCYEGNDENSNELYEITTDEMEIWCTVERENIREQNYDIEDVGEKNSEEYVLKLNIFNYLIFYSDKKIYILNNGKIYTNKKEPRLLKLLDVFRTDENILIPKDKLEEFGKYVLPNVQMKMDNLPAEITTQGVIVQKLASKMLLDTDDRENVLLELKFCYMNYEFNILEDNYKTYVKENNIIRDIPAETEVLKRIFLDGFKPIEGRKQFIMANTDTIYEFLSQKIESYMNDFEVLATEKFKNKQIKRPKISNVGIRIENNLVELDISKINVDISEVKDILKDYNIKKKYYKLKNGDFLDLAYNKDLSLLDEMAETLDIDYSKIKNGLISLPVNRSFYLEKLMNSNKDISISKNEKFTEIVDNIGNSEISNNIKIDDDFNERLRDYQKIGYKWLKTLERYKFGGILADDMGLGKTLQVIAVLKSEIESNKKTTSIVVCPSTLVLNWKAEVEKWCNSIKVLSISGTAQARANKISSYQDYDLIITSYDLLKRDIKNYENINFKYIIADEAQYIKNSTTQNATSLKSLNGEIKFALTGTPIENSIAELWSIFDFIMPGYLYNYNKFKKKFEEPILKNQDAEALLRLKKLISPFILRRVKKDVLTELPEKNITVMKNEMEKEQEKIYLSYLIQTKKEIAEELSDNSFEKSKFKILMLLTRLRQICCHPSLFIENYTGESGKLNQCLGLICDAIEAEHKILLFSSYTSMFEIIEDELKKRGIEYFKLVGNTPVSKRIEMVDEFNNNKSVKVFLISLKAGGTGLNLTSADVVIHYDPWWNISSENQATDRAYRIGQKNSVQVYKLITSNSIEEKINKMQERKEKLSKDVLSTEETFINKMSKQEILDLFE